MEKEITAQAIKDSLFELSDPQKKEFLPYFFKTGPGQYGAGDKFIGVVVPKQCALVKTVGRLHLTEIKILLHDDYHECRLTGLLFLISAFEKATEDVARQEIYEFYIANHQRINNWDLVDLSAPQIVGNYLLDKPREVLMDYAKSGNLWLQRIAIVSTYRFIKEQQFNDTFVVAELLLNHSHDLIHKAVGWMLREVGKRDFSQEYDFLLTDKRYKTMPRTMLRYAIEKFPEPLRQDFLKSRL